MQRAQQVCRRKQNFVQKMFTRDPSEPLEKNYILIGRQIYSGGHAESIGPRPSMEDACVIVGEFAGPGTQYYAIYDGHGGSEVSIYCANNIHRIIQRLLRTETNMDEIITKAIKEVHETVSPKWPTVGTTAALAFIMQNQVISANVGDSRVILISEAGVATRLSYDHKASDPEERKLVIERGGHMINDRVNGILMLSRAIGDGALGNAISCEPYIQHARKSNGMKLILACDGVWDVMDDQTAADFAMKYQNPAEAARIIKDEALARGSQDNVTCVVVNLTPK